MSKEPALGRSVAHFILPDGTPACSHVMQKNGLLKLGLFKRTFVARRPHEHLCSMCRRLHAGECACSNCRIGVVQS